MDNERFILRSSPRPFFASRSGLSKGGQVGAATENGRATSDGRQATSVCFISLDAYPLFSRQEKGVQDGSEVDIYMLSTELTEDKRFCVSVITGDYGRADVETADNITIYKAADLRMRPLLGAVALKPAKV